MPDSSPRDIEDKNRVGVRQSQMRVRTATNFNGPNDTNGSMTTELDKTVRDYSFPAEKLVAGLNSQLQAGQSSNRTHLYPNGLSSWLSRIVPQSIHAGCSTPEAWKLQRSTQCRLSGKQKLVWNQMEAMTHIRTIAYHIHAVLRTRGGQIDGRSK